MGVIFAGVEIEVEDRLYRGVSLDGVNSYFRDKRGWYYWSGKAVILYKALNAPSVGPIEEPADLVGGSWALEVAEEEVQDQEEVLPEEHIPNESTTKGGETGLNPPEGFPSNSAQAIDKVRQEDKKFIYPKELVHWGLSSLHIPELFWAQAFTGRNIKIAMLAGGVNVKHPDIRPNLAEAINFCGKDRSEVNDEEGYGSYAAALIAGAGRHEWLGVAPQAQLFIARISKNLFDKNINRLIEGWMWAIDQQVDVIFLGVEFKESSLSRQQLLHLQQVMELTVQRGILCIAPVGNGRNAHPESRYPAAMADCLSVGAYSRDGSRSVNSLRSTHLDIVAPGEDLFPAASTVHGGGVFPATMAAAFTSGVAGLILNAAHGQNQLLTPLMLIEKIRASAVAKYAITKCRDIEFGCGFLSPENLVTQLGMENQEMG